MTTATETTEAIEYARSVLNRAGTPALAEIIGRYDRLLAEDEPGMFSWHQALYDVAQQAKQAAEALAATLPYDPVPDLGRLLCAAQRQGHRLPGLEFVLSHLMQGLSLPPLAYSDEAESAIREALGALTRRQEGSQ
jgi:hypothetical protein